MENKFKYLVEKRTIETRKSETLSEIAPIIASAARGAIGGAARVGAQNWLKNRGNISREAQSSMDAAKDISSGTDAADDRSNYGKIRNSNQNYTRTQQGQKSAKDDDPKNIKVTQMDSKNAYKPERGPNKLFLSLILCIYKLFNLIYYLV